MSQLGAWTREIVCEQTSLAVAISSLGGDQIIGRDAELARIARFIEAVPAGPSALVLAGEAGIGKTVLWRAGVSLATKRGHRILSCRPGGAEVQLSFAGLGDLLEGALSEALAQLPPPQSRALETALLLSEASDPSPDPRALGLAFLNVLRELSARGPVLIAVDDLQWLDAASARVVEFALRRLVEEPVGLLGAVRTADDKAISFELDGALGEGRVERITIGPLSVGALHELLQRRLGANLLRPTLLRVHQASGGNAFFALEIGRELVRQGVHTLYEDPLPVPADLRELLGERLARLPTRVRRLLLHAAAVSRPTIGVLELVARDRSRVDSDLRRAAEAVVIELEGEWVRFTHPLLASVTYQEATAGERRTVHRDLAKVVVDPEERARHLALAAERPDPRIAAALDDAAHKAHGRGAPEAAAELTELALRMTPADHADDLRRRMFEAAEYHERAGGLVRARTLLEEAVARSAAGPARAEAVLRLVDVLGQVEGFRGLNELLAEALAEAGDDAALKAQIHVDLAVLARTSAGHVRAAEPHARAAVELAEELGDPSLLARALVVLGMTEFLLGRGIRTETMNRAIALEESARSLGAGERPRTWLAIQLMCAGDLDRARAMLEDLRQLAIERGDQGGLNYPLFYLSWLECRAGNWERASGYGDEGYRSVLETGDMEGEPALLFAKALVAAHLGQVDEARESAQQGLALAERVAHREISIQNLSVLGFLELSLGNAEKAHRFLARATELLRASGIGEPGLFSFPPDAIEALIALGDLDEAQSLLAWFEGQGRKLDRAWALATAARCRGLLAETKGDREGALACLQEALKQHERVRQPFEHARTLLALGAVERRAGKKRAARESLEQSLAIFDRLEARLWSERARSELGRIGGRNAPGAGVLSATERQIADLVAAGRTNHEVAEALHLSTKTVAWNLSKIYRKLGVRSRTELAARERSTLVR